MPPSSEFSRGGSGRRQGENVIARKLNLVEICWAAEDKMVAYTPWGGLFSDTHGCLGGRFIFGTAENGVASLERAKELRAILETDARVH